MPLMDEDGNRIGTVEKVWFDGSFTVAEIDCVPEDLERTKFKPLLW